MNTILDANTAGPSPALDPYAGETFEEHVARQLLFHHVRQLDADTAELKQQQGTSTLTDHLSTWLAALFVVAAKTAANQAGGCCVDLKTLRLLTAGVCALRRGDQYAEWLRLGQQRLELENSKNRHNQVEAFRKWNKDEKVRAVAASRDSNAETIDALGRSMFEDWDDDLQTGTPACPSPVNPATGDPGFPSEPSKSHA